MFRHARQRGACNISSLTRDPEKPLVLPSNLGQDKKGPVFFDLGTVRTFSAFVVYFFPKFVATRGPFHRREENALRQLRQ